MIRLLGATLLAAGCAWIGFRASWEMRARGRAMGEVAEGLELLERLLGKTNATAASDFGVACLSLRAGLQGAWLNVCINTGSLCDAAFAADARAAGQKLLDAGLPRAERCYAAMLGACSEE